MKKVILVSAALLTGAFMVNAQLRKSIAKSNTAVLTTKRIVADDTYAKAAIAFSPKEKNNPSPFASSALTVGYTKYDLQSNNASARRIINHPDGTISFCWTIADDAALTTRGTGWNYYNPALAGNHLLIPGGTLTRLETVRTGFSQIALLGNGSEVILCHRGPPPYKFMVETNGTKGSQAWTFNTPGVTLAANAVPGWQSGTGTSEALWCRMATGGSDGNSIHLIANYFPSENDIIKGILAPFVYSRSQDAGLTWDLQSILLPGYDSTRTLGGDAETYSIDAVGDTIAILHGGLGEDLTLWKSTDNGTNWMRTQIDSIDPFAPSIDSTGGITDTLKTNDGSMSVAVDPSGKVHVAYATERILDNGIHNDGLLYTFPEDMELIYWNDVAKQKVIIPIADADIDTVTNGGDGDGNYTIGSGTAVYSSSDGTKCRYGNKALLNCPSIATDGNNIFILFSLPGDGDSTVDGQSFRDIWIVASSDGGVTWGKIQNISCTRDEEDYYASLAKRVDAGLIHILYQWDQEPGSSVPPSGDPIADNEIRYAVINKAAVLAGTAGCSASVPLSMTTTQIDASVCISPCNGMATAVTAGGVPPYTYLWGTSPAQTTQTATGLCPGNYAVSVSDASANTAGDTVTIICVAGVNEYALNAFVNTYPNPVADHLSVILSYPNGGTVKEVSVYNSIGKKVMTENFSSSKKFTNKLYVASLPAGVYFMEVKDEKNIYRTKFIK